MPGKIFLVKIFLKMLHSTDGLSSAILVYGGILVDNSSHPWSIKLTSDSTSRGERAKGRSRVLDRRLI